MQDELKYVQKDMGSFITQDEVMTRIQHVNGDLSKKIEQRSLVSQVLQMQENLSIKLDENSREAAAQIKDLTKQQN